MNVTDWLNTTPETIRPHLKIIYIGWHTEQQVLTRQYSANCPCWDGPFILSGTSNSYSFIFHLFPTSILRNSKVKTTTTRPTRCGSNEHQLDFKQSRDLRISSPPGETRVQMHQLNPDVASGFSSRGVLAHVNATFSSEMHWMSAPPTEPYGFTFTQ